MIPIRRKFLFRYVIPGFLLLVIFFIFGAAYWYYQINNNPNDVTVTIDKSAFNNIKLKDNPLLYTEYDGGEVVKMYVTVYKGVNEDTGEIFDMTKLNSLTDSAQGDPALRATVKIFDKTGKYIVNGTDGTPNCELSQRGESARKVRLKSYKIKLYDGAGSFRGQSVLNLNKNRSDPTRIKSKFSFDYIALFPDMISLRTSFVQLFVKDATLGETEYKDYGLFTQVEQPNRDFLRAHGLDPNGTIYKPSDFEFFMQDAFLPEDDPDYNYDLFLNYLKIRENPDNPKLIAMLTDINNRDLDFNDVFSKYFDKDNYLTWVAMNLLIDNYDTVTRNFLLYTPSYSNKWFFLPWDYDRVLLNEQKRSTEALYHFYGIERYWGSVLHNRFFRDPENVKLLDEKVDKLYSIMTDAQTEKLVNAYEPIAKTFLSRLPDSESSEYVITSAVEQIATMKNDLKENYNRYYASKKKPMPFFTGVPKEVSNGWYFNWDPSFDLQGDSVSYTIRVAKDITFKNIVYEKSGLYAIEHTAPIKLSKGDYYWTVIATDTEGNTQTPFEYIREYVPADAKVKTTFHGVKRFTVN